MLPCSKRTSGLVSLSGINALFVLPPPIRQFDPFRIRRLIMLKGRGQKTKAKICKAYSLLINFIVAHRV